jgi:hypothetical protein
VTLLEAYGARLAIEATMGLPVALSRNQRSKIPDEPQASTGLGAMPRGVPHV